MFDFCYVANLLLIAYLWIFPNSAFLFKVRSIAQHSKRLQGCVCIQFRTFSMGHHSVQEFVSLPQSLRSTRQRISCSKQKLGHVVIHALVSNVGFMDASMVSSSLYTRQNMCPSGRVCVFHASKRALVLVYRGLKQHSRIWSFGLLLLTLAGRFFTTSSFL